MKRIIAEVDYVQGRLHDGYYELILTDEEYEEYQKLSEEEQKEWIQDGEFVLSRYDVDDMGKITDIHIEKC